MMTTGGGTPPGRFADLRQPGRAKMPHSNGPAVFSVTGSDGRRSFKLEQHNGNWWWIHNTGSEMTITDAGVLRLDEILAWQTQS